MKNIVISGKGEEKIIKAMYLFSGNMKKIRRKESLQGLKNSIIFGLIFFLITCAVLKEANIKNALNFGLYVGGGIMILIIGWFYFDNVISLIKKTKNI